MNPAQQARTAGFTASLSVRGVRVYAPPYDVLAGLLVILEPVESGGGEFAVARETATAVRMHVLRDHLAETTIGMGSVLRDSDAAFVYRVILVEDNPANVVVVFTCEAATYSEP